jgi:hypothetical protein
MTKDPFLQYVDDWDKQVARKEELVAQKKALTAAIDTELGTLTTAEMVTRKGLAAAVVTALGDTAKEGVNKYTLVDGRKLKVTISKTRTIEVSEIENARVEWGKLNEHSLIAFDSVFRLKHELAKAEWNKLTDGERLVMSRAVVTKDAAPTVVFD